ncbi:MAG: hypothetical protein R3Y53_07220 [Bacillota bacterium]
MRTYLQYYHEEICPNIAALDIFLKTKEEPYHDSDVARVLCIEIEDLRSLLESEQLAIITKGVLFLLLEKVANPFCQMICKEMQHVKNELYSVADIAYIYELPEISVKEAIEEIKLDETQEFTYEVIQKILDHIYI